MTAKIRSLASSAAFLSPFFTAFSKALTEASAEFKKKGWIKESLKLCMLIKHLARQLRQWHSAGMYSYQELLRETASPELSPWCPIWPNKYTKNRRHEKGKMSRWYRIGFHLSAHLWQEQEHPVTVKDIRRMIGAEEHDLRPKKIQNKIEVHGIISAYVYL